MDAFHFKSSFVDTIQVKSGFSVVHQQCQLLLNKNVCRLSVRFVSSGYIQVRQHDSNLWLTANRLVGICHYAFVDVLGLSH